MRDPLLEEYAIASQIFKLSSCDLSEVCCNSVLASSFPDPIKADAAGDQFRVGTRDPARCSVPLERSAFRRAALEHEVAQLVQQQDTV